MFQGLQAGMPLYILYKNDPKVVEARVVSCNTHPPVPNPNNPMAILNGPVTDVTVTVDGKTLPPFQGLSPNAMMATFSNDGMFISEDRGLIINEVTSMRDNSQRIVESFDIHKSMVEKCNELLLSLNPEKQKELAQAKEMSDLKGELAELKGMLSLLLGNKQKKKEE